MPKNEMFSKEERKKAHEETLGMAKKQLSEAEKDEKESKRKNWFGKEAYLKEDQEYAKKSASDARKAYDILSRYKEYR